jgi:general secretion pathway protein A
MLRDYDRPALIALRDGAGGGGSALVSALAADEVRLATPEGPVRLAIAAVDRYWFGDFLLLWRPPPIGRQMIAPGSSAKAVAWLRAALEKAGGKPSEVGDSGRFDDSLRSELIRFQRDRGLTADGIAGPETLIRLNTAAEDSAPPRLAVPGAAAPDVQGAQPAGNS